jgi:7-carboxy-7-deazaguanine synthase
MLCDNGYQVSIETSGAIDISQVDQRVSVIMDIKTPGSGEASKNLWSNVAALSAKDEVKFVLVDRTDYDWAKQILGQYDLTQKCPVLFSPVYKTLPPADLAAWVLEDHLQVRMQVQLHKILWGEKAGV